MTTFTDRGTGPPDPPPLRPVHVTRPDPEPRWEPHFMEISPRLKPWFGIGVALVPGRPIGTVLSVTEDARQPPVTLVMDTETMLALAEAATDVAEFALSISGARGEAAHREAS